SFRVPLLPLDWSPRCWKVRAQCRRRAWDSMYLSSKRVAMFVACLAAAGPALSIGKPPKAIAKPAGAAAAPDGQEIVVTGARPVVVGARARPCVALPGDPLDSVKVEVAGPRRQDAIVPMGH